MDFMTGMYLVFAGSVLLLAGGVLYAGKREIRQAPVRWSRVSRGNGRRKDRY